MWTQEFILLYLTNRAKSPRSLTSSTKSTYNRLSQSPSLLVSGSRSSLSLCQQKHKKFLARSLRLRNILSLTWEQVFDLLHSSLLITVGNKGNTLWFCFESNWKKYENIVAALKLVGCGPSITSWSVASISQTAYNNSNVIVQAKKSGNYMYSVVWRWDYDLFHASMQQGKDKHRVSKASSLSLTFNSH